MNVGEKLAYCNFIANKEQSGKTLSPDEYNLLLPQVQIEYLRRELGLENDYQPGRPVARISKNITSRNTDNIRVFKVTASIAVNSTTGQAPIPTDYYDWDAIRTPFSFTDDCNKLQNSERPVEIVDENEWGSRLTAAIRKPTKGYPICKFNTSYLDVAPKSLGKINFVYFRKPVSPVYAFTIVNDEAVYDAVNSVQLELPEITHYALIGILLSKIGINLSNDRLLAYAEMIKNTGK